MRVLNRCRSDTGARREQLFSEDVDEISKKVECPLQESNLDGTSFRPGSADGLQSRGDRRRWWESTRRDRASQRTDRPVRSRSAPILLRATELGGVVGQPDEVLEPDLDLHDEALLLHR